MGLLRTKVTALVFVVDLLVLVKYEMSVEIWVTFTWPRTKGLLVFYIIFPLCTQMDT